MSKINDNQLAREISRLESKRVQVNIAQIKEVLRCTKELLQMEYLPSEVIAWLG